MSCWPPEPPEVALQVELNSRDAVWYQTVDFPNWRSNAETVALFGVLRALVSNLYPDMQYIQSNTLAFRLSV
jgi:hypothetical protein